MEKIPIEVYPSILAADFGRLADEAGRLEDAGADGIHIDIMDGHFVPNLTLGPKAIADIRRSTSIFLDVHIMIYNPCDYVERLVEAGSDRIIFHIEATEDVEDTLNCIHKCNCQAGLALNPETAEALVPKYLDKCDSILMMTVHPGFGGQKFVSDVLQKIEFVRQTCEKLNLRKGGMVPQDNQKLAAFDIGVDGGINMETARLAIKAGANILVAGTHLFRQADIAKGICELKNCMTAKESCE